MLNIRKILCPTDFSDCASHAVEQALALAQQFDAELHILHAIVLGGESAVDPMSHFPAPEEIYEKVRRAAHSLLGHPAEAIANHAAQVGSNLIVMATEGRTGLDRLLLGSTAEKVLRSARCCDVMTISADAKSIAVGSVSKNEPAARQDREVIPGRGARHEALGMRRSA